MGNLIGGGTNVNQINNKYSDAEIKERIGLLFYNNKDVMLTETSAPQLMSDIESPMKRRNLSAKRYKKYALDINQIIQDGGVIIDSDIHNSSDHDEPVLPSLKTKQDDMTTHEYFRKLPEVMSPTAALVEVIKRGGGRESDDEIDDEIDFDDYGDDDDDKIEFDDDDFDDDSPAKDSDGDDILGDLSETKKKEKKKEKKPETESSFNSADSELKILPFYSTSSASDYSFRKPHPYIKSRFN